ncbi:tyrosine-type recombinase/integrase [Microbulbifer agarilyticus]|uniref:site-specific integrase n=1 Tax=Microbulbifer agarilyticus TaxID=260552 RepID=UPI001C939CCB|nr:tyrosine-type recombinase/integrase [Microbulbifer agarilyticus]MBY6212380.1 tyrosine-type recombinase/integrase [Microbulbifer agarilyticus]
MATIDQQYVRYLLAHPPEKQMIRRCDHRPGFGIRYHNETLYFIYRRKIAGKVKTTTLGDASSMSFEGAVAAYQKLRHPDEARRTVEIARPKSVDGLALSTLQAAYLEHKSGQLMEKFGMTEDVARKTTQYKEVKRSLKLLSDFIGHEIAASEVERDVIYACLNARKKVYPKAAQRAGKWICSMYNFGRDRFSKDIKFNPADRLKLGVDNKPRQRALNQSELKALPTALLAALKARQAGKLGGHRQRIRYHLYVIMQLLVLLTGQRGIAVRHMLRDAINGDEWLLDAKYTKHMQYDEVVCLSSQAQELIELALRLSPESMWVFPSRDDRLSPIKRQTFSNSTEVAWKHSGGQIAPYTAHDLRRTCATVMARRPISCPRDLIDLVLGHSRPGLEQTYVLHSFVEQKAPYQQALGNYLVELWGTSYDMLLAALRQEANDFQSIG